MCSASRSCCRRAVRLAGPNRGPAPLCRVAYAAALSACVLELCGPAASPCTALARGCLPSTQCISMQALACRSVAAHLALCIFVLISISVAMRLSALLSPRTLTLSLWQ